MRHPGQFFDKGLCLLRRDGFPHTGQKQREKEEGGQLGGEGLGGSHADLRSGMSVENAVGLSGDHASHAVADGDVPGSQFPNFPLSRQGVRRFSRLGDQDTQGVGWKDGFPVAVLGGVLHLDRHPGQALDHEFAGQSGVPARAATNQANLFHLSKILLRHFHLVEDDLARVSRDTPQGGVPNGPGLLVNFLQHEMFESTLFGHDGVPGDALHPGFHRSAPRIGDFEFVRADGGQIAVAQKDDVPGMRQDRRDVRGHKGLPFPNADDDRRALAGGHQRAGLMQGQHHQSVEAGHFPDGLPDCLLQATLKVLFDQVGNDLRVGLGDESMSIGRQGFLEGQVVFDDPVVDHHELPSTVAMGMGVFFSRPAVGCPAGVANAHGTLTGLFPDRLFKIPYLARGPADMQMTARDDRNSG